MIVGFDFDNTIVFYGDVFSRAALRHGYIPSGFSRAKNDIRDEMHRKGLFDEWTALQGEVYGSMMDCARLFPGVMECFRMLSEFGVSCYIISHKTRYAKKGIRYDLHESARKFIADSRLPISGDRVFFCPGQEEKIQCLTACACTHFVDDLPEVFADPAFPSSVKKLLLGAEKKNAPENHVIPCEGWKAVQRELLHDVQHFV